MTGEYEYRCFWEESERPFIPYPFHKTFEWANITVSLSGKPIQGITEVKYVSGKKIITEGIPATDPRFRLDGNPPQP